MIDLGLWYLLTDPFEEFDENDRRSNKEKERKAKDNGRDTDDEPV